MTSIQQIESILVTAGASIAKIASESQDDATKLMASLANNRIGSIMFDIHLAKMEQSEAREQMALKKIADATMEGILKV